MNYSSRTVVSVPVLPTLVMGNKYVWLSIYKCLLMLGAGGRGTEATVLLGGRLCAI